MRRSQVCVALLAALFAGSAAADDGLIAPSDILGLRVTDWLPVDGELREWTAITGAYVVSADGTATFPYIGEIEVAGQSPGDLGAKIGEALKQRFALADRPYASVSIDERRPVLVGGAVERPGEVPYVADMTARHAIALAGGVLSPAGDESSVLVQSLTAEAQVRILTDQEAAGVIRVARLRAELEGAAEIAPDALPADGGPTVLALKADAERLLTLRRESFESERQLIDSRIVLLDQEITALTAKEKALDRQKQLAAEQKSVTEDLAERGLAANARLLDAERSLVTIETQVLDVSTALLEARQELEEAKAEAVQLPKDRATEVMTELQTAEVELAEIRERLVLQRSLSALLASNLGGEADEAALLSVTVYRGGAEAASGGLDTVLRPGDLVEVTLAPAPEPQGG
ncbi:polysaccharide biosynthesis/export family protein [Tabrizicola sp.]|uniref:polysaccharide biosynthesis/export family protein n=1 Tax=Tabrizicola sp. TaxID=2005166 RepID=UPI003F3B62DA